MAGALWYAAMLGSAALALWLVGVRDWRVYALCAATDGIVQALHVGSITPLLMLLAAVAWRYRDKALVCGLAIALGVGLKLAAAAADRLAAGLRPDPRRGRRHRRQHRR